MGSVVEGKRVALFIPSLRGGGAERVAVRLVHGFLKKGLLVDLVLVKAEGPYLKELPNDGNFRLVNLGSSRVLYSLPGLVKYLRKENPDAFLSFMNYVNIVAIGAKMWSRYEGRFVVSERTNIILNSKSGGSLRSKAMPFLVEKFYGKSDKVVCVSKHVAIDLKALGVPSEKLVVIYNPVITSEIFEKAEEPLDHLWFREGVSVILGVGRLTDEKDFFTLLRAFSLVRREKDARLVILGEGEERERLLKLSEELGIKDYVDFPGFDSNPYRWMKKASVFVLSSRWEGLPNALIEALASGTPVVSTNCPSGPREILENGKWGRLVPVGDSEALARAIFETLSESKRSMPEELKEHLQKFTLDEVVEQYIEVLF